MLRPLFLLLLPAVVAAFMPWPQRQWPSHIYSQNENDKEEEEEPKLVLDGIKDEMNRLKSKYPTSEVDYLAAARKRAQEARESINDSASEEDWLDISQKQSAVQAKDDWEASLHEAGNEESQILIPVESSNDDGDDEEPKLLLF